MFSTRVLARVAVVSCACASRRRNARLHHAGVYKRDIGIAAAGWTLRTYDPTWLHARSVSEDRLSVPIGKDRGKVQWACARKPRSEPEWGSIGTIASTPTWR